VPIRNTIIKNRQYFTRICGYAPLICSGLPALSLVIVKADIELKIARVAINKQSKLNKKNLFVLSPTSSFFCYLAAVKILTSNKSISNTDGCFVTTHFEKNTHFEKKFQIALNLEQPQRILNFFFKLR
jgi:hypothetical protein